MVELQVGEPGQDKQRHVGAGPQQARGRRLPPAGTALQHGPAARSTFGTSTMSTAPTAVAMVTSQELGASPLPSRTPVRASGPNRPISPSTDGSSSGPSSPPGSASSPASSAVIPAIRRRAAPRAVSSAFSVAWRSLSSRVTRSSAATASTTSCSPPITRVDRATSRSLCKSPRAAGSWVVTVSPVLFWKAPTTCGTRLRSASRAAALALLKSAVICQLALCWVSAEPVKALSGTSSGP